MNKTIIFVLIVSIYIIMGKIPGIFELRN